MLLCGMKNACRNLVRDCLLPPPPPPWMLALQRLVGIQLCHQRTDLGQHREIWCKHYLASQLWPRYIYTNVEKWLHIWIIQDYRCIFMFHLQTSLSPVQQNLMCDLFLCMTPDHQKYGFFQDQSSSIADRRYIFVLHTDSIARIIGLGLQPNACTISTDVVVVL